VVGALTLAAAGRAPAVDPAIGPQQHRSRSRSRTRTHTHTHR